MEGRGGGCVYQTFSIEASQASKYASQFFRCPGLSTRVIGPTFPQPQVHVFRGHSHDLCSVRCRAATPQPQESHLISRSGQSSACHTGVVVWWSGDRAHALSMSHSLRYHRLINDVLGRAEQLLCREKCCQGGDCYRYRQRNETGFHN